MDNKRSSFSGKIGFVLAAAGSAVGLGNIWRFPYLAAQYGGGVFLLVYILLSLTFGFSLMIAEIAIGRKTGQSPIGAFTRLDRRFSFLGYLAALVPVLILPYYSVIGGWVSKYVFTFLTGGGERAAEDGYFSAFIAQPIEPIGWFFLFLAATALIVLFGVNKGIEKVSRVMMPVLAVLVLFVAVYASCMPGAWEGVLYYITPDFSRFSYKTVVAALGQLFYSMSLAMGIMITYGSYMKKEVNLETSVHQIEIFDTCIAFFAGLMIVPPVFALSGGTAEALGQGPGLMFVTLPKVFANMTGGGVIGAIFFLLVLFAALTSAISLMETIVSTLADKLHWSRRICCLAVFAFSLLLGIPSSLGNGLWSGFLIIGQDILTFFDFISNSILMPIVALLTCIFVGYVIKTKPIEEEVEGSAPFRGKRLFRVVIRYVAPVCLLIILVTAVLGAFGVINI